MKCASWEGMAVLPTGQPVSWGQGIWREIERQENYSKTAIRREQRCWEVAASTFARAYNSPSCNLLTFEVV